MVPEVVAIQILEEILDTPLKHRVLLNVDKCDTLHDDCQLPEWNLLDVLRYVLNDWTQMNRKYLIFG